MSENKKAGEYAETFGNSGEFFWFFGSVTEFQPRDRGRSRCRSLQGISPGTQVTLPLGMMRCSIRVLQLGYSSRCIKQALGVSSFRRSGKDETLDRGEGREVIEQDLAPTFSLCLVLSFVFFSASPHPFRSNAEVRARSAFNTFQLVSDFHPLHQEGVYYYYKLGQVLRTSQDNSL